MKEHDPRRLALDEVAPSTYASIRAALVTSLESPSDDSVAALFRAAREAARRERVPAAHLVAMIASAWADVAATAKIPAAERGDRLAAILTHAIAWVIESENPKR